MLMFFAACLSFVAIVADPDSAVRLTDRTEIRFATPDEGRAILTADDPFTANLSRFDLQCRLKTDKDVTLAGWKQFVAEHVRAWEPAEIDSIGESLDA